MRIKQRRQVTSLEDVFPLLRHGTYWITSCQSDNYNCVAHVFGDEGHWWQPASSEPGHYWPDGIPNDPSLDSYIALFASCGYDRCVGPEFEAGYRKIAIYVLHGWFRHVAWQDAARVWRSKLGESYDIEHDSLEGLARHHVGLTQDYGSPEVFMKCALPQPS